MKRVTIVALLATGLLLGWAASAGAVVHTFDFETPWSGDYAPGWELEGYRHDGAPVAKMEQVAVGKSSNYGAKIYVDSVPQDWMWWAAVHVARVNPEILKRQYDPWVSVWMYDQGYGSGKDATGQLYTVPSWVVDEDWTDVQFGGRPWGTPEGAYYYTWADSPNPPWQQVDLNIATRPNYENNENPAWVHLKMQLSSTDNLIHYYLNDKEVGRSTSRNNGDYLDLGTLIMAVMFDDPLSEWGDDKPYVIIDDFAFGSTSTEPAFIPEPASVIVWGLLGAVAFAGAWVVRRRS